MQRERYNPPVFPFSALVGQDLLRLGLILNAINPQIGGILIRGEKGTAKSTAARALAQLLPPLEVVPHCFCYCDPADISVMCSECRSRLSEGGALPVQKAPVQVVDLPLNTTEDRLVGSLDFEYAIRTGIKRFYPGLLSKANRGILYIDEVNLLEDHLVDILLDVAVSGINVVQREGICFVHPSRFILIATMNPEEGDIRPQLMDRFGLAVNITGLSETKDRVEIVRRQDQFDADPDGFLCQWDKEQDSLRKSIMAAKALLGDVTMSKKQISEISNICLSHHVAGHRADIIMEKTARTLAALDGRNRVTQWDIQQAAQLVLPHRTREQGEFKRKQDDVHQGPKKDQKPKHDLSQNVHQEVREDPTGVQSPRSDEYGGPLESNSPVRQSFSHSSMVDMKIGSGTGVAPEEISGIGDTVRISTQDTLFARETLKRRTGRRRTTTTTSNKTGRYVRSTSQRLKNDLAFDATLRAAAPHQRSRPHHNLAVNIIGTDIREKVRQKKTSYLLLFVVDASGSMGTKLMTETKGTILALLLEAYQKRDKVGMVAFKSQEAEVILPPTNSIEMAKKLLENLPTGGTTPLGLGLLTSYQLITTYLRKDPGVLPLMVIVTDGRANVGINKEKFYEGPQFGDIYREIYGICHMFRAEGKVRSVVIDTEEKSIYSFDRSRKLANALNAKYYILEDMISKNILETVKKETAEIFM